MLLRHACAANQSQPEFAGSGFRRRSTRELAAQGGNQKDGKKQQWKRWACLVVMAEALEDLVRAQSDILHAPAPVVLASPSGHPSHQLKDTGSEHYDESPPPAESDSEDEGADGYRKGGQLVEFRARRGTQAGAAQLRWFWVGRPSRLHCHPFVSFSAPLRLPLLALKGGYHPVQVGERYKGGRYVVLKKLGWGHFSTVWLVRDTETEGFAALKASGRSPPPSGVAS